MVLNFTLLSLLPYEQESHAKDIVQKYNIFKLVNQTVKILLSAILAFENKEFEKFDAQVGETQCQIRAYKINLLSEKKDYGTHLENLKKSCCK